MERSREFDVPDLDEPRPSSLTSQKRYQCVDCSLLSPVVETAFTLISSRFGWRLHRYHDNVSGEVKADWRCPTCFRLFREERRRRAIASFAPPPLRDSGA